MKNANNFSTPTWNCREGRFLANVRRDPAATGPKAWMKVRIPQDVAGKPSNRIDAEAWLIGFVAQLHEHSRERSRCEASFSVRIETKKTLAMLIPKWLELRRTAIGSTRINYYWNLFYTANNWILDNPKFKHLSIQNLDIETELTADIVRDWIHSMSGAVSSRFRRARIFATALNEMEDEEWFGDNFVNPFSKKKIKKVMVGLEGISTTIKTIPQPVMLALLTSRQVPVLRRIRYLLLLALGCRTNELQGLTWQDVHMNPDGDDPERFVPYVQFRQQLIKPGRKPVIIYDEEIARGSAKDALVRGKRGGRAVVAPLKTKASANAVPLHPSAVSALKALYSSIWREETGRDPEDDDPVLPYSRSALFTEGTNAQLREDLKKASVPVAARSVTKHAFRRSFSSQLAKARVQDILIDRLLRHKLESTARQSYILDDLEPLLDAVCKLQIPNIVAASGFARSLVKPLALAKTA